MTTAPVDVLLPFASLSWTVTVTGVPTVSDEPVAGERVMIELPTVAAPAVPVVVKVAGLPESPLTVAVTVFVPTLLLIVQSTSLATPETSVLTAVDATLGDVLDEIVAPAPDATANVTETPETGLP
jgi:hypothetical protein